MCKYFATQPLINLRYDLTIWHSFWHQSRNTRYSNHKSTTQDRPWEQQCIFRSGTELISSSCCCCSSCWGDLFRKSLRLCRFKSDRGEIWQYFKKVKVKELIAVNGTPSHNYGVSLAVWDHTVLPPTRHKRTHPALYSIYRPFKDGRLSKPRPAQGAKSNWPTVATRQPGPARPEPTT